MGSLPRAPHHTLSFFSLFGHRGDSAPAWGAGGWGRAGSLGSGQTGAGLGLPCQDRRPSGPSGRRRSYKKGVLPCTQATHQLPPGRGSPTLCPPWCGSGWGESVLCFPSRLARQNAGPRTKVRHWGGGACCGLQPLHQGFSWIRVCRPWDRCFLYAGPGGCKGARH